MANKRRHIPEALLGGVLWDDLWPEVESHLKRVLRTRLPAGSEPADIIQETAARIHTSALCPTCPSEVFQLATRIAINISIDLQRRSRVVLWSVLQGDVRAADDVEREVVARTQLSEICRQMSVSPEELEQLVRCESSEDRTPSAKSKRYRSRQRMRRIRDALGGFAGIPKWRWLFGGVVAAATVMPSALSAGPPVETPPPQVAFLGVRPAAEFAAAPVIAPAKPTPISDARPKGSAKPPAGQRSPKYRSQVKVQAPNGAGVEKGKRDYPDGPPPYLACVRNIAPFPDTCVPHPLRH